MALASKMARIARRCWPRAASKRAPALAAATYPLSSVCFVSADFRCWAQHVSLVATSRATVGTHLYGSSVARALKHEIEILSCNFELLNRKNVG